MFVKTSRWTHKSADIKNIKYVFYFGFKVNVVRKMPWQEAG